MFESRLKELNPAAKAISYDFNSLCQYLDELVSKRHYYHLIP
jgi:hypothetical protein